MHLGPQSRLCFKKRVKRSCFPGSSFLNSAANSMSYSFRHVLNGEWWAICLEHPHSVLLLLVPRAPAGWGIPTCSQHSPSKKNGPARSGPMSSSMQLTLPNCGKWSSDHPWWKKSDHQDPWGRTLKLLSRRSCVFHFVVLSFHLSTKPLKALQWPLTFQELYTFLNTFPPLYHH